MVKVIFCVGKCTASYGGSLVACRSSVIDESYVVISYKPALQIKEF